MKIERILRGETTKSLTVPMGNQNYVFKQESEGGPLIADVKDRDHAEVFLSIPEGYRKHGSNDPIPDAADTTADATRAAPVNAAILDTSGQAPGGSTNETAMVDAFVVENAGTLEDMSDEDLRELFKAELSRTPNARAARETMIAQIEAQREQARANAAKQE